MTNKNGLLPCPFCGEKEDIVVHPKRYHGGSVNIDGHKFWYVECLPCDVKTGSCFDLDAPLFGFKNGKEMAVAKWNRRA